MFDFLGPGAEIFIPDGASLEEAVERSTILAVGAHPDDIEMLAFHGIRKAYDEGGGLLFGVVLTSGAGTLPGMQDEDSQEERRARRRAEQHEAAILGRYSAVVMLDHPCPDVKDRNCSDIDNELAAIIEAIRPETVYLHNPFDRHDTHVAASMRTVSALRSVAAKGFAPAHVWACETWRGLDWLIQCDRSTLEVTDDDGLAERLIGVFHSQFDESGRYGAAMRGRRISNAVWHESQQSGTGGEAIMAIDMLPLIEDPVIHMDAFARHVMGRFEADVLARIHRYLEK